MNDNYENETLALLRAGKLDGVSQLKLACELTEFPREIFDLSDSLEILDLTGNQLSSLPDDLYRLKKLRILFCSSNQFTCLPEVLGRCPSLSMVGFKANKITHIPEAAIQTSSLRWFILTDNKLKTLPNKLGECKKLQKLMLAGNALTELPDSMANCSALELLRISENQLKMLPDWLFTLPKLAWLAYAGNPFSNNAIQHDLQQQNTLKIQKIDWQALTLKQVLGEGASGVTYQATFNPTSASQQSLSSEEVAVKLFKGSLTSDGLPSSEIQANIMAGRHDNLVGIKGIIDNHPENTSGLMMPLLDENLKILADPPNFETCTRDVYDENQAFSEQETLHIVEGVTSAMKHLHKQGLMHGDLYAHNILWQAEKVVLSDLGGASILPKNQPELGEKLKKIECRALNVLLEELAKRSELSFDQLRKHITI